MKIVIAMHHVAQNDQKMHWIRQPRGISLWRSMNRWASSCADSAGDGGGMKCIMNPYATIIDPGRGRRAGERQARGPPAYGVIGAAGTWRCTAFSSTGRPGDRRHVRRLGTVSRVTGRLALPVGSASPRQTVPDRRSGADASLRSHRPLTGGRNAGSTNRFSISRVPGSSSPATSRRPTIVNCTNASH